MTSPTERTLKWLREEGYRAQVVEKWIPQTMRRVDLFGCIDIVAVNGPLTIGVQATSAANVWSRVEKITQGDAKDGARAWLAGGTRQLWVVGWKLYVKAVDGKRWRAIVRDIREDEVNA